MVDYSKWDRMDFSDSDDEDNSAPAPRVTSLNSPGRVTIGTDGNLEIGQSSLPSDWSRAKGSTSMATSKAKSDEEQARKKQKLQAWEKQLTCNGGQHHVTIQRRDEADIKLPLLWSQDRYVITLRLGIPPLIFSTKSIRVRVTGALNYRDRYSAVGSGAMSGYKEIAQDGSAAFGEIEILSDSLDKHDTLLLSGKLPRPVYLNQDEDEIGFDIEDNLVDDSAADDTKCTNFVTITLPKAVPMEGMIIWWEQALLGFPKIDTSSIQERCNSVDKVMSVEEYNASMDRKQSTTPGGDTSKKEAFAKAWEEAHQMFREKVKAKVKQEINVDD